MPPVEDNQDGSQPDQAALDAAQAAASATAGEGDNQDQGEGDQQGDGGQAGADAAAAKAAEAAAKAAEEAAKQTKDPTKPFQERINELTAARRKAERERDEALARLQANPKTEEQGQQDDDGIKVSPAILQEMTNKRAAEIAAVERAREKFDEGCDAAFAKGVEEYGDAFKKSLETCGSFGVLDEAIVADALVTDAPHEVLHQLGSNPELAIKLVKMPREKRIAEFVKMTIKTPAKAPAISKAPAPITPITGHANKDFDPLDPSVDDAEWHRRMDAADKARRAARG